MRINLTDNNIGQAKAGTFLRKDVSALFPIADKTIAQLCHENENLLIFRLTRQSPWRSLTKTPTIFNGLSFKFATFATWNIKQT